MTALLALIASCTLGLIQPIAVDAPDTPAGEQLVWFIDAMHGAEPGDIEARFHPSFNAQVPPAQLAATITQLGAMGPFTIVEIETDEPMRLLAIVYAESQDNFFRISVNIEPESGRVEGLLIQPAYGYGGDAIDSWDDLDDKLSALPGTVSFGAYELGDDGPSPVHELNAQAALPIGSAFKLWILGALGELVEQGGAEWDEPLAIDESLKSLPSGEMQTQPHDAEFPLSEYADKMISISDNTATDHLLRRVGRDRVEAYMSRFVADPWKNRPFLSTGDIFALKLGGDTALRDRFAEADEAERRELLAGPVAETEPVQLLILAWKTPIEIERIEWFAGARDLAATMSDLRRLEQLDGLDAIGHALRINPGIPFDRDHWTSVAYKGGSEPGVLNMTWLVERSDGRWFVLSFGWADTESDVALDEAIGLATQAFGLLAE